jgi:hypothetical protein
MIKDTREETKSKRWLAIYGAMIAIQVEDHRRLTTDCCTRQRMKWIMEEAAAIADLEAEAGMDELGLLSKEESDELDF